MTHEFEKYKLMRVQGAAVFDTYRAAAGDDLDQITSIRMLREVFGLSLGEAKEVSFLGDTGASLEAKEGKLVDEFTKILDEELGLD